MLNRIKNIEYFGSK